MKIFDKNLDEWGKEEVDRLIESAVPESKTIEYKRELNFDALKKSDHKKKFLFNIAAFANTDGGVIFFGIDEKLYGKNTGIPTEICPIEIKNKDKCEQIIADIIGNNFDPSFSHFKIHFISYDDKYIIALELQKALGMPRMVTLNGTNKFYKRRNTGKYLVDTFELQNMFSEVIQNRKAAEEWRETRVKEVRDRIFIPDLEIEHSFFMHVLPIGQEQELIDLTDQRKISDLEIVFEDQFYTDDCSYNFEGYLFKRYRDNKPTGAVIRFVQLFRNGSVEFYDTTFIKQMNLSSPNYEHKLIDVNKFERDIIRNIDIALQIFDMYDKDSPFAVFLTLFNLKDVIIKHGAVNLSMIRQMIGRKQLFFPPAIIYNSSQDIPSMMKPVLDILWQAGGYPRSGNFKNGKWEPQYG